VNDQVFDPNGPGVVSPIATAPVLPLALDDHYVAQYWPCTLAVYAWPGRLLFRSQDSLRGVRLELTPMELSSTRHHQLLLAHTKSGHKGGKRSRSTAKDRLIGGAQRQMDFELGNIS